MKNKKVKISVVATAVALSMTTAVSVGAAVSAQESTGIPNTAMAASSTPTADVVEENGFQFDKSTSFCLPVKKGWHLEQISTRMLSFVDLVSISFPHAHLMVVFSNFGCVFSFILVTSFSDNST